MKRLGIEKSNRKDLRICSKHPKELLTASRVVQRPNGKNPLTFRFTFCLLAATKVVETKSRGLAYDRRVEKEVKNIPDDELKELRKFAAVSSDTIDQLKLDRKAKSHTQMSEALSDFLDIEDEGLQMQLKLSSTAEKIDKTLKKPAGTIRNYEEMSDQEIKKRTGFESLKLMIAFIGIVCNGNTLTMIRTRFGRLTWFEEWMLYFEFVWGRSWLNQVNLADDYGLSNDRKNIVVDSKLQLILRCRASWPRFCSHEEDVSMRSDKWDGVIGENERIIQHDTTSLRLTFKPTLASTQRITYNHYYKGNVAKGNIFLQLNGWIGTDHLWVGAISDSQYMTSNNIFEQQREFQEHDTIADENNNETVLHFTNILDRGYQLTVQAHRAGGQTVRQPVFQHGEGSRFSGTETLKSASCASVRSGNERAVRKAKLAGFLKKGVRPGECPRRFDDVWLAWSFQCNFMYRSTA